VPPPEVGGQTITDVMSAMEVGFPYANEGDKAVAKDLPVWKDLDNVYEVTE
jgi:hypothetical protein